jgi:Tol biopolymer transport system component/DNA-binding winged helix-turn-helix (wHTH) protein
MAGDVLTFGDGLELDRVAYELRRSDRSLKLERIPMEILLLLVERRGQLVSRADIIEKVWGKNIHVDTDNSINAAIRKIRQVLKDDPERPVFVQTVTGKGYRFIAPVGAVVDGIGESNPENTSPWNGAFGPRGNGQGQLTFTPESGSITVAPPASQKSTSRLEETVSFFGTADPAVEEPRQDSLTLRGVRFRLLLLLALCAVAALLAARFRPVARAPHVTRVRQITHVGAVIPNENLVVTVSRIYFEDSEKGENQILSVSLGGETIASIEKPFRTTVFFDLFPSGNELLVGEVVQEFPPIAWRRAVWRLPVPGGAPRRVGGLFADDAAWSPDGHTIAYTVEYDQSLNLVDGDGGNVRRLATFPGSPFKPRWSPDGKLIRISVADQRGTGTSLWQLDASGHNVTRMLPGWSGVNRAWAGQWTRDGRYYFFSGFKGGKKNIWMIQDKGDFFRKGFTQPLQLTDGPLDFYLPTPSIDGKTIYAVGTQSNGKLMRYNADSRQFEPYSNGLQADHLSFSRDGKWMAYVTFPEGALVRSRLDGSERLQLTFAPLHAYQPHWSPDGSLIAFEGSINAEAHKAYVVSTNGGSPRIVAPGSITEQGPDWSWDGQSLLFGSPDASGSAWALHMMNLRTGAEMVLPGTLGMGASRVSPDGRYLAGLSFSGANLLLYDMVAGTTRQLAEFADYPTWSPDGKYIYYSTISRAFILTPEKTGVFRVKVADGRIERLLAAPDFPIQGNWGDWFGLTPDGSLLVLHNLGTSDIYALDIDLS